MYTSQQLTQGLQHMELYSHHNLLRCNLRISLSHVLFLLEKGRHYQRRYFPQTIRVGTHRPPTSLLLPCPILQASGHSLRDRLPPCRQPNHPPHRPHCVEPSRWPAAHFPQAIRHGAGRANRSHHLLPSLPYCLPLHYHHSAGPLRDLGDSLLGLIGAK